MCNILRVKNFRVSQISWKCDPLRPNNCGLARIVWFDFCEVINTHKICLCLMLAKHSSKRIYNHLYSSKCHCHMGLTIILILMVTVLTLILSGRGFCFRLSMAWVNLRRGLSKFSSTPSTFNCTDPRVWSLLSFCSKTTVPTVHTHTIMWQRATHRTGDTTIWTRDLSICSWMLYQWAIHPYTLRCQCTMSNIRCQHQHPSPHHYFSQQVLTCSRC